ncbi:hypothetical protein NQ314_000926 [Rhamnusium bicolor]|uniref:Partner of Y14 and mago n=1 Tax=Rhamnusium bicolor TaxID=1586634 RepID=A0AAV8ZVQ9_9CUCU|nr:hypothetical protein NQ314_000926 [Rhamnusium bicolor]
METIEEVANQLESMNITKTSKQNDNKTTKCNENKVNSNQPQEQTEPTKKLKNLRKRLREVEALEEKLKNGLVPKPEPDQLAKIKRKNDLLMQIHELEKQLQ